MGQQLRIEAEQRETMVKLRVQIEKLEGEAHTRSVQLAAAEKLRAELELERNAGLQREEQLRRQGENELRRCQEEHEEAKAREAELMHMLNEVQDSIITASSGGPPP